MKQLNPKPRVFNAIIEAPRGSRAKFKFEKERKLFKLDKFLPRGAVFPYNFGFLPHTLAEDGDPLDVLVLTEVSAFPGCLVPSRIIGVLEATQREEGKTTYRNDRLIAVAIADPFYKKVKTLDDIEEEVLRDISYFFVSYNKARNVDFEPIGFKSPFVALQLVKKSEAAAEREETGTGRPSAANE